MVTVEICPEFRPISNWRNEDRNNVLNALVDRAAHAVGVGHPVDSLSAGKSAPPKRRTRPGVAFVVLSMIFGLVSLFAAQAASANHGRGTLSIEKTADKATVTHSGTITYTLKVQFSPLDGHPNTRARDISVTDPGCTGPTGPVKMDSNDDEWLNGGETWVYTCTYAVPGHKNNEPDPIVNSATASGFQGMNGPTLTSASSEVSVKLVHDKGMLHIVKTVVPSPASHGDTLNYKVAVTYTPGADGAAARNVVVTDTLCGPLTSPSKTGGNDNNRLSGRETWTYSCTYVVPRHRNNEADPIINTATVNADNYDQVALVPATTDVSTDVVHVVGRLHIVKTADNPTASHGDTITYTLEVTHSSADRAPARDVLVTDSLCSGLTRKADAPGNNNDLLAPNETWIYTCSHEVPRHRNRETNPILNTAAVNGKNFDETELAPAFSDEVSVPIVHVIGELNIVKAANKATVGHSDTIKYTLNVSYNSVDRAPARNVVVTDSLCTTGLIRELDAPGNNNGLLAPRETWIYTCLYAVSDHANNETDPIVNTSAVKGDNFDGRELTPASSDPVSVDVVHEKGDFTIVKKANKRNVKHGNRVTYTIKVTYKSDDGLAARNVVVVEHLCPGTLSGPVASGSGNLLNDRLNGSGNEVWTYTCVYKAPAHADDVSHTIVNAATVSGENYDNRPLVSKTSEPVSVTVREKRPATADLKITKNGAKKVTAGNRLHYTIKVKNKGPNAAEGVTVVDKVPAGTKFVSASGPG